MRSARPRAWQLAAFLLACSLAPRLTMAHDQSFSYADLHLLPHQLELRLTLHRNDVAPMLGVQPESLMSAGFLGPRAARLAGLLGPRLEFLAGATRLPLAFVGAEPVPGKRAVALTFRSSWGSVPGRFRFTAQPCPDNSLHECFLNVYQGTRLAHQEVLTHARPGAEVYSTGREGILAVLATFLPAGIHHILIGPDHILFVVGLLLMGGSLGRILKIVTGFTIAHSITLALASLGLVTPPGRVVEPLIALSVLYVGVENLRARAGRWDTRPALAFVFGLVHGFGFAGVLREIGLPREALGWSLLGFNAGVELGQASIVLAVAPVLALVRAREPRQAQRLVTACSLGVAICGGWWFFSRLLA